MKDQTCDSSSDQFVGLDLYLYGDFTSSLNTNIQYLTRWNTTNQTWEQVGEPLNAPVYAVAQLSNPAVVVGGAFTDAGRNTNANHIAELVGGHWQNLGGGLGGTDYSYNSLRNFSAGVFSLAVCRSNLFAGGDFTFAGDQTNVNGIAMWNGVAWKRIGGGLLCANFLSPSFSRYSSEWSLENPMVLHNFRSRRRDLCGRDFH